MEPITRQPKQTVSPLKVSPIDPDPLSWQAFYKQFSPCERKQFMRNMSHHFSQMIWRHMRKMRESKKKFKESIR